MAERIAYRSGTFAIEMVLQGAHDRGTGRDGATEHLIHILDMQMDTETRAAQRLGTPDAMFGELVGEHHCSWSDANLGVSNPSTRLAETEQLYRVEGPLVELDRRR